MGKIKHKSYVAIFKDSKHYFNTGYFEDIIEPFEEYKKRIEKKHNAKFIYKGEIKNINQRCGVEKLIDIANKEKEELNIKKLEYIVNCEN